MPQVILKIYVGRGRIKSKVQGLCRLQNRSLMNVNEDFEAKRNTENLYKRVKCKVYFAILQRVLPNFGYQIHFLVTPESYLQALYPL